MNKIGLWFDDDFFFFCFERKKKEVFFFFGEFFFVCLFVFISLCGFVFFYNGGGEVEWGFVFVSGKFDLLFLCLGLFYLRVFEEVGGCCVR